MRFKTISFLTIIMYSLSMFLVPGRTHTTAVEAAQANLISDPGFENQTINGVGIGMPWRLDGSGGVDRGLGFARSGANNMWIRQSTGWSNIYQVVNVAQNKEYVLSAWVRSTNQSNGYFGARAKNADGSYSILKETVYRDDTPDSPTDNYKLLTVNFNSGDYTSVEVYIGFHGNNRDAWIQADDFSLVEEVLPPAFDNTQKALKGVYNVTKVAKLTGNDSMNHTDKYDLYGTDLGHMIEMNGKVYMTFGDSYGVRPEDQFGAGGSNWRSNLMAVISDSNPSDGISFDTMITGSDGKAKELIDSKKIDNDELTVIPTGGFSVGNSLYLNFMSIHHWGAPGDWFINYGGLARSTDGGNTWTKLDNVRWPGGSYFTQVTTAKIGNDIYFWCIPQGRFSGVKLMKAAQDKVEDINQYQYFSGTDVNGNPIWSSNILDARLVVSGPIGELSVIWNKYLDRWIMTYMNEKTASIEIREGMTPWGPWSEPMQIAKGEDYPGLYGAFMTPKFTEENGRVIYFTMSNWPNYNVSLMRVELDKKLPLNSIEITGANSVAIDNNYQLQVTGNAADGTKVNMNGAVINYTSSDNTVATVSNSGLITGVKVGTARITVNVTLGSIVKTSFIDINVSQNMLGDPSFENQSVSGEGVALPWRVDNDGGIDKGLGFARTGTSNMWIRQSTGWSNVVQDVTLTKNTNYTLSSWVRSVNQSEGYFGVRARRADGSYIVLKETYFGDTTPTSPTDDYKNLIVNFNSSDYDKVEVFIGFWGNNVDAWIQADDFALTK